MTQPLAEPTARPAWLTAPAKPLVYKSPPPRRFCVRCDRAFHLTENRQIENWAWRKVPGGFEHYQAPLRREEPTK